MPYPHHRLTVGIKIIWKSAIIGPDKLFKVPVCLQVCLSVYFVLDHCSLLGPYLWDCASELPI